MKKLIITFIALLWFTLTNAQSKIIKTAPIANAIGIYNAGFETKFKEKTSFELKAYYFNIFDIKAYKIDVMHNWYTKESLKDFHFGAGAGVFGGDFTTIGYDSSSNKESLTIPLLKINADSLSSTGMQISSVTPG